jgi:hypothetical protein
MWLNELLSTREFIDEIVIDKRRMFVAATDVAAPASTKHAAWHIRRSHSGT